MKFSESQAKQVWVPVPSSSPLSRVKGDNDSAKYWNPLLFQFWSRHRNGYSHIRRIVMQWTMFFLGVPSEDFNVRLLDRKGKLELIMSWSTPLQDLQMLHRKCLHSMKSNSIKCYHPRLKGFLTALMYLRAHSGYIVESMARIPFPI